MNDCLGSSIDLQIFNNDLALLAYHDKLGYQLKIPLKCLTGPIHVSGKDT